MALNLDTMHRSIRYYDDANILVFALNKIVTAGTGENQTNPIIIANYFDCS